MDIIELIFAPPKSLILFREIVHFYFLFKNIREIFGQISVSSVNSTSFTMFWKLLPTFQYHKITKEKNKGKKTQSKHSSSCLLLLLTSSSLSLSLSPSHILQPP